MSEEQFDQKIADHMFKDVLLLPVIVSLSDPNRHFHIPGQGVFAFYFDDQRKLSAWRAWETAETGAFGYRNGGLRATFSTIPVATE